MTIEQPDLSKIADIVFAQYAKLGYEKLTSHHRVFVCVWGLIGEVDNGGLDQYFFNTSGDHAIDAVDSLRAIGANHTAALFTQANSLFGETGPSPNPTVRHQQLDALNDGQIRTMNEIERDFYKYKDNLDELLRGYASKNTEAFSSHEN